MKKEAEESVKSLKSMYGDNLEKTLKQYGYDDLEDYKKKSVYPGLQQKELNKKYIKAKEEEWMEYTSQVTDWEIDRYLGRI